MVVNVTIKIPGAQGNNANTYIHKGARKLADMTPSGNVELEESNTFNPITEKEGGGENWNTNIIKATCTGDLYSERVVRDVHNILVRNISVPEKVSIKTRVTYETQPEKNFHLVG